MIYAIEYEHLRDELVTDSKTEWIFNQVKNSANKHRLELSDEDFMRFYKLQKSDVDVNWLMNKMSVYDNTLTDALILYIVY